MAKKFKFDEQNNMQVSDVNVLNEQLTVWSIAESQIEQHKPMFEADMNASEKTKAQSVIDKLKNDAKGR